MIRFHLFKEEQDERINELLKIDMAGNDLKCSLRVVPESIKTLIKRNLW